MVRSRVEGALEDQRPVRWWRVLPVRKFFGGLEPRRRHVVGARRANRRRSAVAWPYGADIFRLKGDEAHIRPLLATGAAGLAAALTPLAGILFIIENASLLLIVRLSGYLLVSLCRSLCFDFPIMKVGLIDVSKLSDAPLNAL